jgi:hypothetical protein
MINIFFVDNISKTMETESNSQKQYYLQNRERILAYKKLFYQQNNAKYIMFKRIKLFNWSKNQSNSIIKNAIIKDKLVIRNLDRPNEVPECLGFCNLMNFYTFRDFSRIELNWIYDIENPHDYDNVIVTLLNDSNNAKLILEIYDSQIVKK